MTRTLLLTAHDERSDRDALGLALDLAGPLDARIVVGGVVVPGGEGDHKAREDLAAELDTLEASIPDGVESEIRSVDAESLVAGLHQLAEDLDAELVAEEPRLGEEGVALLAPGAAVAQRTTPGAGGPEPLGAQLAAVRTLLDRQAQWLA